MFKGNETASRAVFGRIGGVLPFVAAIATALVVMTARPASAQDLDSCNSEGLVVCGFVWGDLNGDGDQTGEPGLEGVTVYAYSGTTVVAQATTDTTGFYSFDSNQLPVGDYQIVIYSTLPPLGAGTSASPLTNPGNPDASPIDSDGIDSGTGFSYVNVSVANSFTFHVLDFGFHTPQVSYPGTGTPGYWKNHSEAWPVSTITVGGVVYTKAQAIAWLGKVGKDKTTTMFSSLVPAMLNVLIGNPSSCIMSTIVAADAWMATNGPVGNNVPASSPAWAIGEPLHQLMDAYNNGLGCAPHRN
jgi:SdrD B-like domain